MFYRGPSHSSLSSEQDALAAEAALRAAAIPPPEPPKQSTAEQSDLDPDSTSITPSSQAINTAAKVVKKVVKKKLTAKERRERGVTIHFSHLSFSGPDRRNS